MTSTAEVAAAGELRDAYDTTRLRSYVAQMVARREYVWFVAVSELRNRQVTTVLGNLWHLLNPALSIGVYYVIFGLVLKTKDGTDNFILFLTIGLFVFQYTQKATIDGAKSVVGNLGIIKAIKFPRALLPLTSTVTETIASATNYLVIFGVALLTSQDVRWQWMLLLLVGAVQSVFNLGCAFIAARLTTHFRDTLQILPFVFRLLLYGSGVIFSIDAYAAGRWYSPVFFFNPLYAFITIARWCVLGGSLDGLLLVSVLFWTALVTSLGFLWFRAAEERYARD